MRFGLLFCIVCLANVCRGQSSLMPAAGSQSAQRPAEKYHVGITATLGGTPSEENGQWIQAVVKRYKDSAALDSWILMNEPGAAPRMTDTALSRFRIWLRERYRTVDVLNQAWGGRAQYTGFDQVEYREGGSAGAAFADWYAFNRDLLTSNLAWIAGEIRPIYSQRITRPQPRRGV